MWFSDKWRKRNKTLRGHVNFRWRLMAFPWSSIRRFSNLIASKSRTFQHKSSSHYINCSILGGSNGMQIYGNLQGCLLTTCVLFGFKKWHLKGSFSWKLDSFPKAGRSITPLQEVGNRIPIIYKAIYIGMKNSINNYYRGQYCSLPNILTRCLENLLTRPPLSFLNLSKAKDICKTLDDYMCLFNQNTFVKTSQLGKRCKWIEWNQWNGASKVWLESSFLVQICEVSE